MSKTEAFMNLILFIKKVHKKIKNKILLTIYLKKRTVESLDIEFNDKLLEEKWQYRKVDCWNNLLSKIDNNEMIDLSIIVPLYNSEKFIHTCVLGFINQKTKYDFEVILVNDGSKDQTLAIAEEYQNKYPDKIVVIEQDNTGISGARNKGIKAAKGRYLSFVDHDDLVDAYFVEKLMAAAYKEDADIVKSSFSDIRRGKTQEPQEHNNIVICGNMKEKLFQYRSYIFPGVYKRELFSKVNFPVNFWYEDMIVRTLLYRQSCKFVHISDVLYYKQFHEENASYVVWDLKNYKCLEHLYLVMNLIEANKALGLPEDAWFYQCILHELSFILSLRVRKLDQQTRQMVFLKACNIVNDLYKEEYYDSLTPEKRIWHRALIQKEYKLWLLLSGHY